MQSQHLLCALPGHKPPPRHVAEDRSISNTVTRGGQVGGEQAKAEGELPQEGEMITQQLSGASPRETTTRCACGVAVGP